MPFMRLAANLRGDCIKVWQACVTLPRSDAPQPVDAPVARPWRAGNLCGNHRTRGNAMLGLMQDWPLLCHRVIDHAALNHAERPVVTRSVEGPIHTTTYAEIRARALKVAQRLEKDGIRLVDRVATLAWNTWRHLDAWYGIM